MILYCILIIFVSIIGILSDSLNPRRPQTEDDFIRLGHHEKTDNIHDMMDKLKTLREKRQWIAWNLNNTHVQDRLKPYISSYTKKTNKNKPPNILLLFADDLGYGDLSVQPFTQDADSHWPCSEGGILTPNLQNMALKGTIATNFHSASPVCSPSRVSMLTGLYPYRLGAYNAFELGRDMSQRNGFLPQIYATIPELFRDVGYKTLHSGKWHLGGMREEYRVDRVYNNKCTYPSPNQAGFDEYTSELDGPESPRYTFLLRNSILHSKGHRHLLKDDIPMPSIDNPIGHQNILSDHEAMNAIRYIKYHHEHFSEQPWFIQVWFNAPHGPWEVLNGGQDVYNHKHSKSSEYWNKHVCSNNNGEKLIDQQRWQYKTMVSAMDRSIGMLLSTIHDLHLEEDTIIIFTSDNGPEAGAGTSGPYKGGKRSLLEGGIRIPAIFQWIGTIPSNSITTTWGAIPDILPTLLDAAGIDKPSDLHIDGISYLPTLTKAIKLDKLMIYHHELQLLHHHKDNNAMMHLSSSGYQLMLNELSRLEHHHHHYHHSNHHPSNITSDDHHIISSHTQSLLQKKFGSNGVSVWPGDDHTKDRVFLWHYDGDAYDSRESRYQSAAYYHELKIITSNNQGCVDRIYDLRHDPYEGHSLITLPFRCAITVDRFNMDIYKNALDTNMMKRHCENEAKNPGIISQDHDIDTCIEKYKDSVAIKIDMMYPKLVAFIKHGNQAHQGYMNRDMDMVTCDVPLLNQTKKLNYLTGDKCIQDLKCSMPLY